MFDYWLASESDFLAHFTRNVGDFTQRLLEEVSQTTLVEEVREIDHVCYRVSDYARYEKLKLRLASIGCLLSEEKINGRPIATYKLNNPIVVNEDFIVPLIELPAPSPIKSYQEGFEHFEAVVPGPLETLVSRHPGIEFNVGNMRAGINPDVSVKLKSGVVKFHGQSLEQVIAEEKKRPV